MAVSCTSQPLAHFKDGFLPLELEQAGADEIHEVHVKRIKKFRRFLTEGMKGKRIGACYGGAGSGKSVAVAQHIVEQTLRHKEFDVLGLCIMKTMPAVKDSILPTVKRVFKSWMIPIQENKSSHEIVVENAAIHFRSLDDPEKIKSTEFNWIWVEEATNLARDDFLQLNLRLRRPGPPTMPNQMFLTFNPVDADHWTITDIVQGTRPDCAVLHSTYKDNPFLPDEYIRELLNMEGQDPNHYRIYTLGEPGRLENIIYTKWTVASRASWPQSIRAGPPTSMGLDFGYVKPMALTAHWAQETVDYMHELFYKTYHTTADLIAWMDAVNKDAPGTIPKNVPIFADPSEGDRIEEICRAGYYCLPADNSVKAGIDYCMGRMLVITPESPNTHAEIRQYSRQKDKNGKPREEPLKYKDHAMDAQRYGRYTPRSQVQGGPSLEGANPEYSLDSTIPQMYDGKNIPTMR